MREFIRMQNHFDTMDLQALHDDVWVLFWSALACPVFHNLINLELTA